jgi:adenine phosphoribosyltransferase
MDQIAQLKHLIRDVPDFPKPGILFKDFTPLIRDPAGLALGVELMVNPFRNKGATGLGGGNVDIVIGAESRGFIFGIALAQALSTGFVPVRKPGKLPWKKSSISYELEYGKDTLEIHADAISPGQRVLLVDDLLATGGTMKACCELARNMGAHIVGITVLIELTGLKGREAISHFGPVHSVLKY